MNLMASASDLVMWMYLETLVLLNILSMSRKRLIIKGLFSDVFLYASKIACRIKKCYIGHIKDNVRGVVLINLSTAHKGSSV